MSVLARQARLPPPFARSLGKRLPTTAGASHKEMASKALWRQAIVEVWDDLAPEPGTNETGNGSGGDRSCHRGRCALWLRVGGCRLWAERVVPSGAHSSQPCLGSRYSAAPQGVPCRCADDLASCKARSSPSAARS